MKVLIAALLLIGVAACAKAPPSPGSETDIAALAASLRTLSPTVDAAEADRAAHIAYAASFQLAQAYQITDPPLIHNAKVNAGQRPRGLCYHWAEDMEMLLNQEGFKTLELDRAIANSQALLLIEHSTAVIKVKGSSMAEGIIVDPWRKGGVLFWSPVRDDPRYDWLPRTEVLRAKGQIRYVQRTEGSLAPPPAE